MMDFLLKLGLGTATVFILILLVIIGPFSIMIECGRLGWPLPDFAYPIMAFTIFFSLDRLTSGALTHGLRGGSDE